MLFLQIRSNEDEKKKIFYSITGPGADQPPLGLFHIDRDTGNLYISQPLDREKQAKYTVSMLSAQLTFYSVSVNQHFMPTQSAQSYALTYIPAIKHS